MASETAGGDASTSANSDGATLEKVKSSTGLLVPFDVHFLTANTQRPTDKLTQTHINALR